MALAIVDRIFGRDRRLVAAGQGHCETTSGQQLQRRSTVRVALFTCSHFLCPTQSRMNPYLP